MVSDTVETLLFLQELDANIRRNRSELEILEAEEQELAEQVWLLEKRQGEFRSQLEEIEAAMRRSERTVQAGRATLKRVQERAQAIHNMREHLAARAEVDAARRNLDAAEDTLLQAMQDQEQARAALADVTATLEQTRSAYRTRKTEIDARREALVEEIAIQVDRRENRALRIDDDVRNLYDRVRRGRAANALAPIIDGVCGHCYTAIPLQTQAVIRSGRELVICETCGVILHVAE